jgi:hypothetical protein
MCAVCKKAGLECGGYGMQRVFAVSTPRNRHAGYSAPARAPMAHITGDAYHVFGEEKEEMESSVFSE